MDLTRNDRADQEYDPFAAGQYQVGVRTVSARDEARGRLFPCEIWYPASLSGWPGSSAHSGPLEPAGGVREHRDATPVAGTWPLIVFSHFSGGHRRSSTFLCEHLASHGYLVAALDHSEVVAAELTGRDGETATERAARINAIIASRVPDVRFLIDEVLAGAFGWLDGMSADAERVGLVGHSFGGWTVLAVPDTEPRVRALVALAPGGASNPKPGILPLSLTFGWAGKVDVLYLTGEDDVPIPLDGVIELYRRTPAPKRMMVLRRADHQHFVDDVEQAHEEVRAAPFPAEAAWIPVAMRPIDELCPAAGAHLFTCGLTLAHFDAALKESQAAALLLAGDLAAELANRGIEAITVQPDVLAKETTS